ncbi:MAG: ankyrin repeat domain-containing protein [Arcobacteraceae bacterium]|nr:ankyrin repeat domain-containing protein [Arcobacteraceae bacterium]
MNKIRQFIIVFLFITFFSGCGIPAIHQAIATKNNQQLETLVKNGEDIEENYNEYLPWTPLMYAIQTGNVEAAKLLINHGADVKKEYLGSNSLFLAANLGNEELIKLILDKGLDINSKNNLGETILFPVTRTGKLPVVKYLLDNGADVHILSDGKTTVLFSAATSGNVELIDLYIKKGLSINDATQSGITPIFNAVAFARLDALKFLIKNGANPNQKTTENKTPLYNVTITIKTKLDAIKLWSAYPTLQEFIKTERKNIDNLIECWKVLIDAKVDPDSVDIYNKKALDYLSEYPEYYNILAKYAQNKSKVIVEEKTNNEIQAKVNSLLEKEDFEGLKLLTEQNPNSVNYIQNDELRLMLTGPKGMKVGDIKKLLNNGKSDTIVVSLIKRVQTPYKEYTIDEIDILSKMGLSDRVIAAMIDVTTELLKDDKKKKEQEKYLTEQKKISEQKTETKVIYQNNGVQESNPVVDTLKNEATKQIGKMIFDRLF